MIKADVPVAVGSFPFIPSRTPAALEQIQRGAWKGLALGLALFTLAACGGEGAPVPEEGPAEATVGAVTATPPGQDIWLARLAHEADGRLVVMDPANVTSRAGYDNQPYFLPDGSAFWYTVIDDAGQADIWLYDMEEKTTRPVTTSAPESEYSATPLPGGGGFSAIRVEADSTQRLWRFDLDGGNAAVIFPGIAPVGYHAWGSGQSAAMFVLGDPATLQVARPGAPDPVTVARDVGRSLQSIPGSGDVSYVQRHPDGTTEIRRLHLDGGTSELIVAGVEGEDFHAWTPDGVLLQAHEGRVFSFVPGVNTAWAQMADLSPLRIRLSRMAVHPDGTWIALVGEAPGG